MTAKTDRRAAYDKRKGVAPKSYKLPIKLTAAFAAACQENGEPQSAVLANLMEGYINGDRK